MGPFEPDTIIHLVLVELSRLPCRELRCNAPQAECHEHIMARLAILSPVRVSSEGFSATSAFCAIIF